MCLHGVGRGALHAPFACHPLCATPFPNPAHPCARLARTRGWGRGGKGGWGVGPRTPYPVGHNWGGGGVIHACKQGGGAVHTCKQGGHAHNGAGAHANREGKGVATHSPSPVRMHVHPPPRVCKCAPLPICVHTPSLFVCTPPPPIHVCPLLPIRVRPASSCVHLPPLPPLLFACAGGRGGEGGSSRWVPHGNGGACGPPHLWAPQQQGVGTPLPYPRPPLCSASAYTRGGKGGPRAPYPVGRNWGGAGGEGGVVPADGSRTSTGARVVLLIHGLPSSREGGCRSPTLPTPVLR
jgi:hypothetical protein